MDRISCPMFFMNYNDKVHLYYLLHNCDCRITNEEVCWGQGFKTII